MIQIISRINEFFIGKTAKKNKDSYSIKKSECDTKCANNNKRKNNVNLCFCRVRNPVKTIKLKKEIRFQIELFDPTI